MKRGVRLGGVALPVFDPERGNEAVERVHELLDPHDRSEEPARRTGVLCSLG